MSRMKTGDIKNSLRLLQKQLKLVGYHEDVDLDGLVTGLVKPYLPIYHYVFTSYSPHVIARVAEIGVHLLGATDLRFIEMMYKVLREVFSYKPALTSDQFFKPGFIEHKVIMAHEVVSLVHELHQKMAPPKPKKRPSKTLSKPQETKETKDTLETSKSHPTSLTSSLPVTSSQLFTPSQPITSSSSEVTQSVSTLPPVQVIRATAHADQRAMTEKLETIEQSITGLTTRVMAIDQRLAQCEQVLAIDHRRATNKCTVGPVELQNILARLTLLENHIKGLEAKKVAEKVHNTMGVSGEDQADTLAIPQRLAAPRAWEGSESSQPISGPACVDKSSWQHNNDDRPRLVQGLISEVMRENESERREPVTMPTRPIPDAPAEVLSVPVSALGDVRRQQVLRISNMIEETSKQTAVLAE